MSGGETENRILSAGSTVGVLGLGVSNTPLVRRLLSMGARVSVHDRKSVEQLGPVAAELQALGVMFITGDGYLDDIPEDVIFRSPGIRPDVPGILRAIARGAYLTSEMEWFFDLTPATVLGITGSDGKTTTTTLVSRMLERATERKGKGKVWVGGNIGSPLLPYAEQMCAEDFVTVELSSFQLMTMKRSPSRSAITNISPNHLNWHTDMEEYAAAKHRIFCGAGAERVVLNRENDGDMQALPLALERGLLVTLFSSARSSYGEIVPPEAEGCLAVYCRDGRMYRSDGSDETFLLDTGRIKLPGKHNLENYMTAAALTDGLVLPEDIGAVAESFGGVEHRLEYVRTLHGVRYFNSSIDSSPSRSCAALSALTGPLVVICGGKDKHVPFDPLAEALCRRARAVVLTGEAAGQIREAILACPAYDAASLCMAEAPVFADAVETARMLAREGDTVLLSPACTSFDSFRNFEERGNTFKNIVNGWRE